MALTQISTKGIKDGTITGSDLATNVDLVDGQKLRFGTGNDLQIYHDSYNTYLLNSTGNLILKDLTDAIYLQAPQIVFQDDTTNENIAKFISDGGVELYYDGTKKFETTSTGVSLLDNVRLLFGNSDDLRIFHTGGAHSYISNLTNNLYIQTPNRVEIGSTDTNGSNTETSANFIRDGAVELYHNNSKKFETTSYGNLSAAQVRVASSNATTVGFSLGDVGTGFYNSGSNAIGYSAIGTQKWNINSSGSLTLFDNVNINIGTSSDLQIYHDGSNSFIKDTGTGNLKVTTSKLELLNAANNEYLAVATENAAVELYYDGSKKFETTSSGVTITGNATINGEVITTDDININADDKKINIGLSADLQLYHSGNFNFIVNNNSKNLAIQAKSGENAIVTVPDDAVKLYFDGTEKLATSSAGVTVTGDLTVTGSVPRVNYNLIINGSMNVAQRSTSSTTSGYGSVDRFHIQYDGGTVTHTQTGITSGSPYEKGFRNVLRLTNTSTGSSSGNYRNPFQYIEAQYVANSGWNYTSSSSYVTLSFWVRSSVAQEFYGYLRTFDGTGQAYCFSLGSLSANTWTKVTKVIPGNSNITINDDNGAGLQVNIAPFWGSDFTTSSKSTNSWAAFNSGSRTPDYTNTWANTAGATFDITGLQLEVGSSATEFEHINYGDELAKCQRYYEGVYMTDGTAAFKGYASYGGSANFEYQFKVEKRARPTFSLEGNAAFAGATPNAFESKSGSIFQVNDGTLFALGDAADDLCASFSSEL